MMRFFSRRWVWSLAFIGLAPMAFSAAAQHAAAQGRGSDVPQRGEAGGDEIALPETGIRLTPGMLNAMSWRFSELMKTQLDLDDQQAKDIEGIIKTHLAKLANENAETGRDAIEMMMETMIRNDGRFPKEDAVRFASKVKPLIPAIRDYFTNTSSEIGQKLNFKQRLEFSTQMGVVMSGLTVFEQRMGRWEEGKVSDNANPFFDPADRDPSKAEADNADPNEHPEHRRARQDVERWNDWELRIDDGWDDYLRRAADFYEFEDTQRGSGENVLKQMKDRAAAIKTPEWSEKIKQNRIARRLARRAGGDLSDGPVAFSLDREYNKLRKPLLDLDEEFKRRIDELPTSKQREAARKKARKFLFDKGMKEPPV